MVPPEWYSWGPSDLTLTVPSLYAHYVSMHMTDSEIHLGMPSWAFVSYVGHKTPWDVKKVKHNSHEALPQHTPLAESEEPSACTRSSTCWGERIARKIQFVQHYTERAVDLLEMPCLPHKNLQQGGCSWFLPCLGSAEWDSGVCQGGCHPLLCRGVWPSSREPERSWVIWTVLHLLHAWEIQLKSNSLSKHSSFQYVY